MSKAPQSWIHGRGCTCQWCEEARASKIQALPPWPGTPDGSCPSCGVLRDGWDMGYRVARIDNFGVMPLPEQLVSLKCPACGTTFKVAE